MPFCKGCGNALAAGASQCETCGRPVEPTPASASVPPWIGADWQLVGVSTLVLLAVIVGIGAMYGLALTLAAGGGGDLAVSGLLAGVYMVFAGVGSTVAFASSSDANSLVLASSGPALGLLVIPAAGSIIATRYALDRLPLDRARQRAFPVKLGLMAGAVAGILGRVLTFDDASGSLITDVEAGASFVGMAVITGLISFAMLVRRRVLSVQTDSISATWRGRLAYFWLGVKAALRVALVAAAVVLIGATVLADALHERLFAVVGAPTYLVEAGLTSLVFLQGASTEVSTTGGSSFGSGGSRLSLFDFGLPPDGADESPAFLAALLVVCVAVLAVAVYRRLERIGAVNEQDALSSGFCAAAGFAAMSGLAALLGRIELGGAVSPPELAGGLTTKPSLGGAIGASIVWGLVGGVGAALLWSRRRGLSWQAAPPSAATPPPAMPPVAPPPGTRPMAPAAPIAPPVAPPTITEAPEPSSEQPTPPTPAPVCPHCGAATFIDARFCRECGGALLGGTAP